MTHRFTRLVCLFAMLTLSVVLAHAQNKKEGPAKSSIPGKKEIIAEIVSVTKNDTSAKREGAQRLVPVEVAFRLTPSNAKLTDLSILLVTTNTDGKTSKAEWRRPLHELHELRCTLLLPMNEGVFAKQFSVTLRGRARLTDDEELQAVKQGSFPVPAGVVEHKK